jgi:hypothetical protein
MPDEDATIEGGLEPAAEETTNVATEAPEETPDAPTFGVDDIAEGLGSRFQERFLAHHDPADAIAKYGESVEHLQSAFGRLSQGGAPTAEDLAAAEALGIELPQPQEEPEDEVQPIWGAPWAEPTTYEDLTQLAQSDPGRALTWIDKQPDGTIDPTFRQQVVAYWASPEGGNDHAGALAYEREKARADAIQEAKAYADERFEAMRQEFGDVRQKYEADTQAGRIATVDNLAIKARSEIPDFQEHEAGVIEILKSNVDQDPTYLPRLLSLPLAQQLQHISDLTGAAAWRNRPQAQAEAEAEAAAQEQAKVSAGSERGSRSAGASGGSSAQSAMKAKHLADIKAAINSPV